MSLVLPLPLPPRSPHHFPLSRSSTPTSNIKGGTSTSTPSPSHSRPCTPPPLAPHLSLGNQHLNSLQQPISAPPTPVTMTHIIGMERCRSSEAVLGRPIESNHSAPSSPLNDQPTTLGTVAVGGRGGRGREPKATSLLFNSVPTPEQITAAEERGISPIRNEKQDSTSHIEDNKHDDEQTPTTTENQGMIGLFNQGDRTEEMKQEEDDRMDVDEVVDPTPISEISAEPEVTVQVEEVPGIWGMPKWGWEEERKEVRKGVRLVGMEELPSLIEQHSMIDTPSTVLFPWLHGISDDSPKGSDMAAFFGHAPPFQPPPYRGLSVLLAPPHPLDKRPTRPSPPLRTNSQQTEPIPSYSRSQPVLPVDFTSDREPRERSETMSTSSESYRSSGTTEGTSPSVADWKDPFSPAQSSAILSSSCDSEADVQMHPCESKRVSARVQSEGLEAGDESVKSPTPPEREDIDSDDEWEGMGPRCLLLNALHVQDVFDLPGIGQRQVNSPRFRPAKLPNQINLRNLNIQQIKYSTISDLILYGRNGVGEGILHIAEMIAHAQETLYQYRMEDYYQHVQEGEGEGINRPVRYGVWVVVEPFYKIQNFCPHLVNIDSNGTQTTNSALTDLFEREAKESRAMTRGSEVVEGFWVGNDCDIPGGADDGAGATVQFDLCLLASECSEMPTTASLTSAYRKLADLDKRRHAARQESQAPSHSWIASPATIALRNLLSPTSSPASLPDVPSKRVASPSEDFDRRNRRTKIEDDYITLECCGSSRTITGQSRNLTTMTDRIVELVYFLRKIVEGRDKTGVKRKVLVHCQDGYTESTIIVLSYIMSSLSISLPEAYLHLQLNANRSFFLYPSDKPLLKKVDARLSADRRAKALKLVNSNNTTPNKDNSLSSSPPTPTPTSPTPASSRWKNWGLSLSKSDHSVQNDKEKEKTAQVAKEMLDAEEKGGREETKKAKVWFEDRRFDGFPSRILSFLYLGNLEHAGNAAMLQALGITHVVSVGESLIACPDDHDPMHGKIGKNALCNSYRAGLIQVLDLNDIRDDGNDPLRPLIARACEWIERARESGGKILVHCRVGVSRSASIVMAYMMQYQKMGLMDAYLMTRARRLNVLIQPNLRFFHELFGWEIELARQEEADLERRKEEARVAGMEEAVKILENEEKRRVLYTWPAFCRDLHCLNRRFLCN